MIELTKEQIINKVKKYNFDFVLVENSALVMHGILDKSDITIKTLADILDDDIKIIKEDIKDFIIIDNIKVLRLEKLRETSSIEIQNKIDKYLNLNPLALAYLGDAIYELHIRKYLINLGITKVCNLQKESIKYVSAKNQAKYLKNMIDKDYLNLKELDIITKARNHKSHTSKSTDIVTYKYSTALEALIGYLYITNDNKRIEDIINFILVEDLC